MISGASVTVQAPQQFSPVQILDAARRAESEGRREFANQFYHHLLDYYPGSAEAGAAAEALQRMGQQGDPNWSEQAPKMPSAHPPPSPQLGQYAPGTATTGHSGGGLGSPVMPAEAVNHRRGVQHSHHSHAADGERRRQAVEAVPRAVRDYVIGRVIARIMTWMGLLAAIGGAVLAPVSIVMPSLLSIVPVVGRLISAPGAWAWMLGSGLLLVIVGQVGRAVMDMANASRDIAQLRRAEMERHAAANGRSSRQSRG